MSRNMSTHLSNVSKHHDSKWDIAIKDAENEVEALVKKEARLRHAIRIFKANKRDGVPWPEQQKSPQEGG